MDAYFVILHYIVINNFIIHISITSLMCDLHWLPVKKLIVYKLCTLMHAAIHYGTPDYLCLLISVIQQHRSLRSRHIFRVKAIEVPAYSNTGSFVEHGVKAWNELPDILRCTTSRTEFKRELKTHLFSPYE